MTRERRFQAALDALRADTGFAGATAAYLAADGTARGFASGLANVETDQPMEIESRMLAGSIGKTFVAATAIAAARDGALGLDDRLADSALRYFPAERFALAVQINRSYDNDLAAIVDRLAGAFLGREGQLSEPGANSAAAE